MLPKYFKFSADFAVGGGRDDGNVQTPVPALAAVGTVCFFTLSFA